MLEAYYFIVDRQTCVNNNFDLDRVWGAAQLPTGAIAQKANAKIELKLSLKLDKYR